MRPSSPIDAVSSLTVVGGHPYGVRDLYHSLLAASWKQVIGLVTLVFLVINALFGLAYWAVGGIANADPTSFKDQFPGIITTATKNTVIYTIGSFTLGVTIGLVMAIMKMSSLRPYRWFAAVYIEIFRGLPALLTIILVGFGTPTVLGGVQPTSSVPGR